VHQQVLIPSADKWEVLVAAKRKLDALQARMQRGPASLPQARPLVSSSTEARRFPAAAPPTGFGAIPVSSSRIEPAVLTTMLTDEPACGKRPRVCSSLSTAAIGFPEPAYERRN
jgi:hypothetical protein